MIAEASAPAKVILFGEHFVMYGARALLCAVNLRAKARAEIIRKREIRISSRVGTTRLDPDRARDAVPKFRPIAAAALGAMEEFDHTTGVDVIIDSEIPIGAGLGSSSSCCLAAAGAVSALFGELSRERVMEIALEAERTVFPGSSGADGFICAYGGLAEYSKEDGARRIEAGPDLRMIVSNSGLRHDTAKVTSEVARFRVENPDEFSLLYREYSKLVEHAVSSMAAGDLVALGKAFGENQRCLEVIGVSNDKIAAMISDANRVSYGSKITGAGGGGCIISLVDGGSSDRVLEEMSRHHPDSFLVSVDHSGLQILRPR